MSATITTTPMARDQIRAARQAAILATVASFDRPATTQEIMAAMPAVPMEVLPGLATMRKPGQVALKIELVKLVQAKRIIRTIGETRAQQFEVVR